MLNRITYLFFVFIILNSCSNFSSEVKGSDTDSQVIKNDVEDDYIFYIVNPRQQNLDFYWKNAKGQTYGNAKTLRSSLKNDNTELVFAMNGGMYLKNQSPQGLYIEKGLQLSKLDTIQNAYGNFYMQPNGVFYLTDKNTPAISISTDFKNNGTVKHATQSGPMLIIDGKMNHRFIDGSSNIHIRNGVGILPDGQIIFAMSKSEVNFYDFATFFMDKGCKNALYLDGFVSRTCLPAKDLIQEDGQFGVIIDVTKNE